MQELSRQIRAYFDSSVEQAEQIASFFHEEQIERNAFHTVQGTRFGTLSFVQSGYLRIWRQSEDKEVTQWISSPGEFVTDLASLSFDQPARWHIQALTPCTLFTMTHVDYRRIAEEIPEWPVIEKLFLAKCFMTIEERVFSFISMSAEERYAMLLEYKPDLIRHIPLQYLASMLGMTPETMSRVRRKIVS
jgi:CRP-like cAMP-binding protein